MLRQPIYNQVSVREVVAQKSVENLARPRSANNHTEKGPIDPTKDCNQEGARQGRKTESKAGASLDKDKEKTPKEVPFPGEMPREVKGERTVEWSTEIIETIERRDGTSQNKDSVYTPIITTTGYAHALLIQPISGAMLGQLDGHATGFTDAPATRSLNNISPRPFGRLTNRAEDRTTLSRPSTMQNGSPRHTYSRSVPIFGTASAKIVEIRRPKSSEGSQSRLARGTSRNKDGESSLTQRAASPPKHQLGKTQSNAKHREATVRGAARIAMLQSQEKHQKPR
ncbi:hypothetical protein PG994_000344 [Apiospora phragmitis]|uniref:Uncharacterized protein n=1 Tax=Apiospora phragmitis TaxID=2905665 RepID=A0ABR1X654_9PEZI